MGLRLCDRMADPHAPYLRGASERYQDVHAALDVLLTEAFANLERTMLYDMPSWLVARPPEAPRPEREGTLPSDKVYFGLADRKAGVTLNLWYPGDYLLFDHHADALKAAGLKVMRGCLAYNRKTGTFPVEALTPLLDEIKQRDGLG